jgi:hypothetical protein
LSHFLTENRTPLFRKMLYRVAKEAGDVAGVERRQGRTG